MSPSLKSRMWLAIILTSLIMIFPHAARATSSQSGQESKLSTSPAPPIQAAASKPLSLEDRADIFMARKDYGSASDYYYRSLKLVKFKNATLWNKLGIAYQQQMKYHNALRAYGNSTRVDKDFAEAWNNLGTVYFMENKFGKSLKYYQRAIAIRGNDASFHLNLGTSLYHMKNYSEAVEEYRVALGIDPNVLSEQSSLGAIVRAKGTDIQFYFYMAKAFASIGRAEDAVRYLRRAFEDGFTDQKRIDEDPDFQKISQHPAYVELMKNPPPVIKE